MFELDSKRVPERHDRHNSTDKSPSAPPSGGRFDGGSPASLSEAEGKFATPARRSFWSEGGRPKGGRYNGASPGNRTLISHWIPSFEGMTDVCFDRPVLSEDEGLSTNGCLKDAGFPFSRNDNPE